MSVKACKIALRNTLYALRGSGFGIFFIGIFFIHCRDNPFFGEGDVSGNKRQVRGNVVLSEPGSRKDIYVWLEGFNIGSRTDEEGDFQIGLPPPSSQTSSGGVSGVFNLFFYLANFKLATAEVVVKDGEFVFSKGDINNEGELSPPKHLIKNLIINTRVTPSKITQNELDENPLRRVGVTVTLRAIRDSVVVVFPNSIGGFLGAVFLRNIDTNDLFIIKGPPTDQKDEVVVTELENSRSLVFDFVNTPITIGKYEVIPYLLVKQEGIPLDLVLSLGEDVEELGPKYLEIPFRREGGQFEFDE